MKVVQKSKKDGVVTLEATATKDEVNKALNQCLLNFAQQMGLHPDQKKTVQSAIEEKLGVKDPDSMVTQQAMEYLVPFALDKMDITPCFPPKPVMKSKLVRNHPFVFELEVTLKPMYELTSYDPIELKLQPMKVDATEVDRQIQMLADQYPSFVDIDPRPIQKGDCCRIKLECSENGKPMPALTADDRTYKTGAGLMPDGFDSQIIGMDVGETKSFSFEGPDLDENGNEITQTVDCTVTVLAVQEEVKPTIDDEWVKKYMPFYGSLDNMRNMFSDMLGKQHQEEYEFYKRDMAAMEIAKRFKGSIPDGAYESMSESIVRNIQQNIAQQKDLTFDQFVEQNGGKQQFQMMLMMQTRQSLTQGFALDAVFRHEHLSTTEEDIIDACKAINPQYPSQVRKQMTESGNGYALREAAERIRAGKYLVDHAKITYYKDDDSKPAAKAADEKKDAPADAPASKPADEKKDAPADTKKDASTDASADAAADEK